MRSRPPSAGAPAPTVELAMEPSVEKPGRFELQLPRRSGPGVPATRVVRRPRPASALAVGSPSCQLPSGRSPSKSAARMKIVYTHTDEAPALATKSLLPIVEAFAARGRGRARAARHLARRPDPGAVPRTARPTSSASPTRSPSSASSRDARGEHHQAAEHQRLGAAAEGRDRRAPGATATRSPTTRTSRPTTSSARPARATTGSRAARSTRCCARATPTVARRPRSRHTRATTRTRWAPGRPTPARTSRR